MATYDRTDKKNKRIINGYVDKDGMQHRHNVVERDGIIPQHIHYQNGHWTNILNGIFDLIMKPPVEFEWGVIKKEVRKGDSIWVGRGWEHTFIPKDVPDDWLKRWVVDCVYREGLIL